MVLHYKEPRTSFAKIECSTLTNLYLQKLCGMAVRKSQKCLTFGQGLSLEITARLTC